MPGVLHMSMFALLGGGVRVRVWISEQRKIKRRSKALLRLFDDKLVHHSGVLSEPPNLWTVAFSPYYPSCLLLLQPKFFWFVTIACINPAQSHWATTMCNFDASVKGNCKQQRIWGPAYLYLGNTCHILWYTMSVLFTVIVVALDRNKLKKIKQPHL